MSCNCKFGISSEYYDLIIPIIERETGTVDNNIVIGPIMKEYRGPNYKTRVAWRAEEPLGFTTGCVFWKTSKDREADRLKLINRTKRDKLYKIHIADTELEMYRLWAQLWSRPHAEFEEAMEHAELKTCEEDTGAV